MWKDRGGGGQKQKQIMGCTLCSDNRADLVPNAEPHGQVGQEKLNIWAANCSRLTLHPVYWLSGAKECQTLRALVLPYTMIGHERDLHSPKFAPGNPTLSLKSRFVSCLSVYHLLEMLPGDLDGATSLLAMK
jgi:hypothetical protein